MTDKPILFNSEMVRALLDGRKTQTRRMLSVQPDYVFRSVADGRVTEMHRIIGRNGYGTEQRVSVPLPKICVGDRLWVRERFAISGIGWGKKPSAAIGGRVHYHADPDHGWQSYWGNWHPSIHMPRWASRLTLTVTDVRVQRLQDISREDCVAEGCKGFVSHDVQDGEMPEEEFRTLWDSLNAKRGYGWKENPWISAYSFEVFNHNIDRGPR